MTTPSFAPIAPPHIAWELKVAYPKLFGKYHLVLAHEVVKAPHEFRVAYSFWNEGTIILDNGAAELGASVSAELIEEAFHYIEPNVVALPDVLTDKEKTLEAVAKFTRTGLWRYIKRKGVCVMGIPQGETIDETMDCAEELHKMCSPEFWGVAKWMGDAWGTRREITSRLYSRYPYTSIHILGFSENIPDDIRSAKQPGVVGIDSARPILYGLEGHILKFAKSSEQKVRPHRETSRIWNDPGACVTKEVISNLARVRLWLASRSF